MTNLETSFTRDENTEYKQLHAESSGTKEQK